MTLPYFAIALLVLATIYSAIVSFRQESVRRTPEDQPATWIFPEGPQSPTRIVAILASVVLLAGSIAWLAIEAQHSIRRSSRFLIPEGYAGWVRIEFEIQNAPALPVGDNQNILKIPPDAVLRTSSPQQYGVAKDSYFFYSTVGLTPLSDSGPGRMIWGKISGEDSASSGRRKFQEFFVGTEQQFQEQAGGKVSAPEKEK